MDEPDTSDIPETSEEWFRRSVPRRILHMTRTMPFYICHKRVQALEIASVGPYFQNADDLLVRNVGFQSHSSAMDLPAEMFSRYEPQPGDFYVVYEDGYQSFSPREAFLNGYAREEARDFILERIEQLIPAVDAGSMLAILLQDCRAEIQRLRADTVITRQMAGFREIKQSIEEKKREKADPDQPAG